ncbi:Dynein heavy chain [Desulfovibrio ferrophilus]|uniref:Dynein heavy chain n=1 Tax=Desulfovibrio ferrophilus TaxID=241368 RepID=A0A2Z6B0Y6_9BACT|nr:Dynein heavy chain [Desulfovibrio ferrophilus]
MKIQPKGKDQPASEGDGCQPQQEFGLDGFGFCYFHGPTSGQNRFSRLPTLCPEWKQGKQGKGIRHLGYTGANLC